MHLIEHDITPKGIPFYSVKIKIGNHNLQDVDLACIGNGNSYIEALLSAYGELWERIMNNAFFRGEHIFEYLTNFSKKHDEVFFRRLQDSKINLTAFNEEMERIPFAELSNDAKKILSNLFNIDNLTELELVIKKTFKSNVMKVQSFLKYNNMSHVKLPSLIMQNFSSVNGMCSGINKKEAILRGICEIIEKHYTWKVYMQVENFPQISISLYKNLEIYKKIEYLENRNYSIRFFDCSFDTTLPVIGILVINKSINKYAFTVSCHPNLEKVITRGLVKIFKIDRGNKFNDLLKTNTLNLKKEFFKSITDGSGIWPSHIFQKNHEKISHWLYPDSNDHINDLDALLKTLTPNYDIYIRDNTLLGIPALYINIPSLSEIVFRTNTDDYFKTQKMLNSSENIILKGLDKMQFINPEKDNNTLYNDDFRINYLYIINSLFLQLDEYLLKGLINLLNHHYVHAEAFLKRHALLNNNKNDYNNKKLPNLFLMLDHAHLMQLVKDTDESYNILSKYYSTKDIEQLKLLINDKIYLNNLLQIPQCYNCSKCNLHERCFLFKVTGINSKIKGKVLEAQYI